MNIYIYTYTALAGLCDGAPDIQAEVSSRSPHPHLPNGGA